MSTASASFGGVGTEQERTDTVCRYNKVWGYLSTDCALGHLLPSTQQMEVGQREANERKRSNGEAVPDRNVGIYFTHMLHL